MAIEEKKGGNIAAIGMMFALFFMIAFVTNLAGSMGVVVKNQFGASDMASQFGSAANFFAYLFMGIPGGLILKRKGYKFTSLLAVAIGIAGMGVQLASGYVQSFAVYVTGAFVAGFAMCLLNLVVNPLLNTLGGEGKKGNQLVQFGCTLNSVGATLAPIFLGHLVGGEVARAKVADAFPVMYVAIGIFALAFVVIALSRIPEPHMETTDEKQARLAGKASVVADIKATLGFRHFTLGAVAIFLYIIIESGIPNFMNLYMTSTEKVDEKVVTVQEADAFNESQKKADELAESVWNKKEEAAAAAAKLIGKDYKTQKYVKPVAKPGDKIVKAVKKTIDGKEVGVIETSKASASYVGAAIAGVLVGAYWFCMMIGRLVGGVIGSKVSSRTMIVGCSILGMVLMLATMYTPLKMITVCGYEFPLSMCFGVLCGLCTSVMWGGIFNMAAEGLGKYVPMGSGIFMAMVFGGMLLPVQGWLAGAVGYLNSYWMTIGLFAYVLFYALVGSKVSKRA